MSIYWYLILFLAGAFAGVATLLRPANRQKLDLISVFAAFLNSGSMALASVAGMTWRLLSQHEEAKEPAVITEAEYALMLAIALAVGIGGFALIEAISVKMAAAAGAFVETWFKKAGNGK